MALSPNDPAPKNLLRAPRGFVSVNGIQIPWEKAEISNTRYSSAGTFRVTIPVSKLPKNMSLATLLNTSPLTIQINAGVPFQTVSANATPSDLPMLILGDADSISYEPHRTLVTITGRDYVSLFIENKVIHDAGIIPFENPTSAQIITNLANLRGLEAVVSDTEQGTIGTYLQTAYQLITTQITEWDLMTFIAREENFDLYVIGKKLYFQASQASEPYIITLTTPYYSTAGGISTSNAENITLTRNLRLLKDIIVTVTSWDVKEKINNEATATLVKNAGNVKSPPQTYNYTFPNLTPDQCQQKADSLLKQISAHEMNVTVRMPADQLITANSILQIKNTNTAMDQTYFVKNVTRELDFTGGFIMQIDANNKTPFTTTENNSTATDNSENV